MANPIYVKYLALAVPLVSRLTALTRLKQARATTQLEQLILVFLLQPTSPTVLN